MIKSKDLTIKTSENEVGFHDHTRISGQIDRLLMPASEYPAPNCNSS